MNSAQILTLLPMAAEIEDQMADLYMDIGTALESQPRARQFFVLLSYEEKTHANVLRLAAEHISPDLAVPESKVPASLLAGTEDLKRFSERVYKIRSLARSGGVQLHWALQTARDLESAEVNDALHWLTEMGVEPEVRKLMTDLLAGTWNHEERIAAYMKDLGARGEQPVLESPKTVRSSN